MMFKAFALALVGLVATVSAVDYAALVGAAAGNMNTGFCLAF